MKAKDYITKLIDVLESRTDIVWEKHPLLYKTWTFDLLKIQSKRIAPTDKVILITSGIHGEEIAGPLSLLTYMDKILDLIHTNGYKCIIYPLDNPSGFECGTRYNIDSDEWWCGNNDFLRYQLADGTITDECKKDDTFKWYRSSDPELKQELPLETALLHSLLRKDPLNQIVAHLDLHQDYITPIEWSYVYFYTFSDTYQSIISEIKKHIPLLANTSISAGQSSGDMSNDNACIMRHDGTINDLFYRIWIPDTIAIETTGQTPLPLAEKINRLWIQWMVLLLNERASWWPKKNSSLRQNEWEKIY